MYLVYLLFDIVGPLRFCLFLTSLRRLSFPGLHRVGVDVSVYCGVGAAPELPSAAGRRQRRPLKPFRKRHVQRKKKEEIKHEPEPLQTHLSQTPPLILL